MVFYTLKVVEIKEEAKDTRTYYMEKPEDFTWVEGSHTHIGIVGFNERTSLIRT